jgi:putative endonuclease
MHDTDVLASEDDGRFYTGATEDLRRRVEEHGAPNETTSFRSELVHYEASLSPEDAFRRERYRKSGRGGRYPRQRLASSLSSIRDIKLERH